jgi:hypothetical protein
LLQKPAPEYGFTRQSNSWEIVVKPFASKLSKRLDIRSAVHGKSLVVPEILHKNSFPKPRLAGTRAPRGIFNGQFLLEEHSRPLLRESWRRSENEALMAP